MPPLHFWFLVGEMGENELIMLSVCTWVDFIMIENSFPTLNFSNDIFGCVLSFWVGSESMTLIEGFRQVYFM